MRVLTSRRFWLFFLIPQIAFGLLAASTQAVQLLPVLSLVISALAIGICFAFLPSIVTFFLEDGPIDTGEALAVGIWCTWFATALIGLYGFAWRYLGQPIGMMNNDFVAYMRFLNICGAMMHLASPGAITDRIPAARWVKIGAMIATLVVVFFLVLFFAGIYADFPNKIGHSE